MNRKPIEGPIAIRALQTQISEVERLNNQLPRRIVVTQETYDKLYEEVLPYLRFKANKSGTWFCGVRVEVGETDEIVIKEFKGGTPGGKLRGSA